MARTYTNGNLRLIKHDEGDRWMDDMNWNMDTLDTQISENEDEVQAARGSALTLSARLGVELENDGTLKLRSTITSIESEVEDARGTQSSLDARLSVALQDNGSLRPGVIEQTSLTNSTEYNDGYTGNPQTTQDDLNRLRNEVKVLKGTLTWEADVDIPLQDLGTEVSTARGTLSSLNERLSVSLADDGTFNPIPQIEIQKSVTYNDEFTGTVNNLEDDLNWIRTVIRDLKDDTSGVGWNDPLAMTTKEIIDEIVEARGNTTSVDDRISGVIDDDGNIVPGLLGAQSNIDNSAVYDDTFVGVPATLENDLNRIRNILKLIKGTGSWITGADSDINTLYADLQSVIAGVSNALNDRADTTLFFPVDGGAWATKYRLHQFQGRESELSTDQFWFNVTRNSPLDVDWSVGTPQPGAQDDTSILDAENTWYYVYIIGNPTSETQALVYSMNPPQTGPLLSSPSFAGYTAWRYVAEVVNGLAGGGGIQLVPCRRYGNHTEYEQAQRVTNEIVIGGSGTFSLADRIPPTSMRANLTIWMRAGNGGAELSIRPAVGTMGVVDVGPISGNQPGGFPRSLAYKLYVGTSASAGQVESDGCSGWCATDVIQRIDWNHNAGGSDNAWYINVNGYITLPDFSAAAPSW